MADPEKAEQPWAPLDLDDFVARLRDVSGTRPPALGELRRAGKFDAPVVPPPGAAGPEASDAGPPNVAPETTATSVPAAIPAPGQLPSTRSPDPPAPGPGPASVPLPASPRTRALLPTEPQPPGSPASRPGPTEVQEGTERPALAAFLPDACVSRLAGALDLTGLGLVAAPDLPTALASIARERPPFVFTGLELGNLHAPSLIAALRACPFHRCVPIAVITNRDPSLLDLSLYRPDAVLAEDGGFEESVQNFVTEFRTPRAAGRNLPAGWWRLDASVLLVESSTMTRRYVGKVLHVAGAEIVAVEDAAEAMIVAAALEFDLVLLDLELPGAESQELARYFRNALATARIIGLTSASPNPHLWGLDTLLHKPIRRSHLIGVCDRLLRPESTTTFRPRRAG